MTHLFIASVVIMVQLLSFTYFSPSILTKHSLCFCLVRLSYWSSVGTSFLAHYIALLHIMAISSAEGATLNLAHHLFSIFKHFIHRSKSTIFEEWIVKHA